MPIYEVKCQKCGFSGEVIRSFVGACNMCGGDLEQVVAATNFKLVGDGWAKDGYGGKKSE